MACYTSRTYEERRTIQKLWEAGVQTKEIADKQRPLKNWGFQRIPCMAGYGPTALVASTLGQVHKLRKVP